MSCLCEAFTFQRFPLLDIKKIAYEVPHTQYTVHDYPSESSVDILSPHNWGVCHSTVIYMQYTPYYNLYNIYFYEQLQGIETVKYGNYVQDLLQNYFCRDIAAFDAWRRSFVRNWSLKDETNLNPYSAGIDFSRQNLTSVDVRFWRPKSIPAL